MAVTSTAMTRRGRSRLSSCPHLLRASNTRPVRNARAAIGAGLDRLSQIFPIGIDRFDGADLPSTRPAFDRALATDRLRDQFIFFDVDEALDVVAPGEDGSGALPVLIDAGVEIARHTRVERTVFAAGKDVNITALGHRHARRNLRQCRSTTIPRSFEARGLDGRDEHGHDEMSRTALNIRHARTRCGHPMREPHGGMGIGWP